MLWNNFSSWGQRGSVILRYHWSIMQVLSSSRKETGVPKQETGYQTLRWLRHIHNTIPQRAKGAHFSRWEMTTAPWSFPLPMGLGSVSRISFEPPSALSAASLRPGMLTLLQAFGNHYPTAGHMQIYTQIVCKLICLMAFLMKRGTP